MVKYYNLARSMFFVYHFFFKPNESWKNSKPPTSEIYIYISFRRLKGCCFGVVNKQYGPTNKETKFLEHFPNIEEHHMFFFQLSLFFPIFTIESSPIPQYYPILQLYPATMGQNKQSSQLNPSGPPEPHEKLGAIFWGTI